LQLNNHGENYILQFKDMIIITHTPKNLSYNRYTIESNNIDELVKDCVSRIRPQSKKYYESELIKDLESKGKSLIDVHAGLGISYVVILNK